MSCCLMEEKDTLCNKYEQLTGLVDNEQLLSC